MGPLEGKEGKSETMGALPLEELLSLVPLVRVVQAGERSLYWLESSDGRQTPAAGAAALERRLTEQSLAAAAAPARTLFVPETDAAGSAADWDEFDRRLERDARRYDGGMGIY